MPCHINDGDGSDALPNRIKSGTRLRDLQLRVKLESTARDAHPFEVERRYRRRSTRDPASAGPRDHLRLFTDVPSAVSAAVEMIGTTRVYISSVHWRVLRVQRIVAHLVTDNPCMPRHANESEGEHPLPLRGTHLRYRHRRG